MDTATPPTPSDTPESRGLYGRSADLLAAQQSLESRPILTLYGLPGIGKSKLIQELTRTLPHLRLAAYEGMRFNDLYFKLAGFLGCREDNPAPLLYLGAKTDFSALDSYINPQQTGCIHIERADQLMSQRGDPKSQQIAALLQAIVTKIEGLNIILERNDEPPDLLPAKIHEAMRLQGLPTTSLADFFRAPFHGDAEQGWHLSDDDLQIISHRLAGREGRTVHPLALSFLAMIAAKDKTTPLTILKKKEHVLLNQLEQELFNDLYDRVLSPAERRLLQATSLYRDLIPDSHVDGLNAWAKDPLAFDHLIRICLLDKLPGQSGLDLYHTVHYTIAQLTRRRLERERDVFAEAHECIGRLWQTGLSTRLSLPNLLKAAEAAYHYLQGEAYGLLAALPAALLKQGDLIPHLEAAGKRLRDKGQDEDNKRVLELWLALDPQADNAHRYLGATIERLYGQGHDEALEHHLKAYHLKSTYPPYLSNVGRCYRARKEYGKFVALVDGLTERERRNQLDEYGTVMYAECLAKVGRGAEASAIRQEQISHRSRNAVFYAEEARYLGGKGEWDRALAILDQADKHHASNAHTLAIRATALGQLGRHAEASALRQAEIAQGSSNPAFYNDEARYLAGQEAWEPALRVLDQAAAAHADNDHTLAIRGTVLEGMGRWEEASQLRRREINKDTYNPVFYNDEAKYLDAQGDVAAALALLELAEARGCADEYTRTLEGSLRRKSQPPAIITLTPESIAAISTAFNLTELKTMCAFLGVTYEELGDDNTPTAKARELAGYLARRGQTSRLLEYLQKERPHLVWQ